MNSDTLRKRVNQFRDSLARFFVGRREIIDLMLLSAIAEEPLLLVGPPGTAKSDLVVKFKDALGVSDDRYFEYMLTRFSEPSEIVGPVDINRLRDGQYVRRTDGRLPTAQIAFLDEIFKSNSAILNILLTIINERKFYQDGRPEPVALRILFAATNEIPRNDDLAALNDRFTLKAECRPVRDGQFVQLIESGIQADSDRYFGRQPWCEGLLTIEDINQLSHHLNELFAQSDDQASNQPQAHSDQWFPARVLQEFQRLVKTLAYEDRIFISDRRIVKLYKLLRIRAWLRRGGTVEPQDLQLLQYIGNTEEELSTLRKRVPQLLDLDNQHGTLEASDA